MDRFREFLERLIRTTHTVEDFDREKYVEVVKDICEYYGICKGVSEFYPSMSLERLGQGEVFCDYDNGEGEKVALLIRVVTKTKAVVKGVLYIRADDDDFDEETSDKLYVLLSVILRFISFRRLQRVVEEFGFRDEMGFYNYRAFARYLDIQNEEGTLVGKLAFNADLHNFTLVNQEIGRLNGDIVLENYYNFITEIVGDEGIVCRLGGDKFVGIVTEDRRDRLFQAFEGEPIEFGDSAGRRVVVSASAGVFKIPNSFVLTSLGDIMDKIMLSCIIAKKNDSSVVMYDQSMNNMNERAKWVQRKFRDALVRDEFKAFYQPKVDITKGEVVGAEALCRWFHEGGIIPPIDFIPVLEQGMDICDLDFYMLDRVCKDIRRWLDEGREVVKVSVNLSRKHLVDVDLLKHIMGIIDSNDVPHQYIEIELTETTTDVQFRDLKRVVTGLRREGVSTAVDDFGIGYSSLNLIREVPWDVIKVDKNFLPLDGESENSITNIMFRHVIAMAHDMGIKCVVEGVETKEQLELLRKNECYLAQGFYYDKPLPVEDFEKRLNNKKYD